MPETAPKVIVLPLTEPLTVAPVRQGVPLTTMLPVSRILRGDEIEWQIWTDVERFLRDPGDVLADLEGEVGTEGDAAIAEVERITLERALAALNGQRKQVLALTIRGRMTDDDAEAEFDRIDRERSALEARVAALEAPRAIAVDQGAIDLLDEIRRRLDAGLSDEQRQAVVQVLVKMAVHSDAADGQKTAARVVVEYRFPRFEIGGLQTHTGTGSSPR